MIAGSLEIQLLTNIARLQKDMSEARRSVGEAMASVEKSTAQAAGAMNYMIGVAKSLVGALGATQIIALADQYTKYTAQIKLATSGMTEYANAVNSVRQISKAAQTDIAATGTLFARITNGTRELGFGQARVIEITEAVTLALKVSGATAQESASAMLQLAQAFGSGVLRGEEFNAVNEAAPRLMKALADGMGQPIGALRDLATQGLITSEVMANSLPKALAELRQEAAQVQTISGAFVVLKNNLVEFVGTQAQASGAVSVLTGLIGLLAENLSLLTSAAIGFASAKIAQTITGMATATFTAVTASQAQRVATLAAAQAQAQATGTTAALTAARVAELRASVLAAEGNVALAVTTNGLVPAQARAAAAATAHAAALGTLAAAQRASSIFSAGLTGALGLLGGPIGAITLALGLGVAAWMAWGSASQSGENQAVAAIEKSTPEILEELDKQIAKLRERNALAGAGFEQLAKEGGDAASKMARLQKQIEDLTAGRGIDGSGPLPEAARLDLLQRLTMQYGQLAGAVGELRTEQEKLDSQGKRNTDVAELRNKQAGEAAKERAQEAKKAADEAKRLREEEEKFRIAWGREDSTRQGESVMKRNEEEAKAQAKAIDELFASRDRLFDQAKQNETNANAQLEAIQFETAALTMTNVEREQAIALRELERTGLDKTSEAYKQLAEDIKKAVGDRAALQQQISDFQNVWNSVDRTAQQAFTNIFEGGQDAFTKLRDTLKATLLDLLYQMTVRKWVFNMAANVTGASSGAVGAVANSSGLNSIGGLLGNFSGMSMANTAGSMFANATGGGLDALLATNGAFGTAAGGAGIMGTLSAALPWVGGALAIASMLESPRGGPKTIGGEANAATIQAAVAATLTTFGVSASNFRVGGFSASDPAGDSLTQVQAALFMGDRALYSRQDRVGNYEDVGRSAEAEAAAWAEEQSRIMLAALQATLEPKYQQYISDVSADASALDEINAALARLNAARTLEEQLLTLSSTDAENMARARQRELDAMDAALRPMMQRMYALQDEARITGKITSVMGDYLSDTELRAARIWQIHQQLAKVGIDVSLSTIASATRADFRALYEEMVRVGDMGAAEALLDVASAFAQITEPANQAATAIEDMAQRLQDAGRGVWDYVRTLTATRAGTASPMDLLTNTRSNYLQDLALSRAGDLDAYGRINSSAQAYIDAQKGFTASGGDTQAVISQIISELNSLPAVQSYEQQNLALLGQIAQATGATSTSTGGSKVTGDQILARLMEDSFLSYSRAEVASVYNAIANNTATSAGYLAQIAYHTQLTANQLISGVMNVRSEYRGGGLATFEAGGFHTGGLRLVGERGPELEVTGPSRIFNAQQTRSMLQGSGGASAEEIRGLREDVRRLTAVVAAGANANLDKQDAIVTNTRRVADRAELMAARP